MAETFVEHDVLDALRRGAEPSDRVTIPIGDDAALVAPRKSGAQLICVDTVVEGVHAEPGAYEILARKVVRSNLSDIAAMGGRPDHAVLSIAVPNSVSTTRVIELVRTVADELASFGSRLVGGDTVAIDGPMVLTLTLTGQPFMEAVRRDGARPDDVIVVTGSFGGSILGRHADFTPRLKEAEWLVHNGPPSAMTDVSDGLLRDLFNICEASGVGADIWSENVPVAPAAREMAASSGRSALDHALADGEDFELLLTMSSEVLARCELEWKADGMFSVIGKVTSVPGLRLWVDGHPTPVEPGGWDHGETS